MGVRKKQRAERIKEAKVFWDRSGWQNGDIIRAISEIFAAVVPEEPAAPKKPAIVFPPNGYPIEVRVFPRDPWSIWYVKDDGVAPTRRYECAYEWGDLEEWRYLPPVAWTTESGYDQYVYSSNGGTEFAYGLGVGEVYYDDEVLYILTKDEWEKMQ